MENKNSLHSFVNIKDRKSIFLDGVVNVERFDESAVTLISDKGRIEIEGQGLKIISLEKDGGKLEVSGRIDGVFYEREKTEASFFKRIFG